MQINSVSNGMTTRMNFSTNQSKEKQNPNFGLKLQFDDIFQSNLKEAITRYHSIENLKEKPVQKIVMKSINKIGRYFNKYYPQETYVLTCNPDNKYIEFKNQKTDESFIEPIVALSKSNMIHNIDRANCEDFELKPLEQSFLETSYPDAKEIDSSMDIDSLKNFHTEFNDLARNKELPIETVARMHKKFDTLLKRDTGIIDLNNAQEINRHPQKEAINDLISKQIELNDQLKTNKQSKVLKFLGNMIGSIYEKLRDWLSEPCAKLKNKLSDKTSQIFNKCKNKIEDSFENKANNTEKVADNPEVKTDNNTEITTDESE